MPFDPGTANTQVRKEVHYQVKTNRLLALALVAVFAVSVFLLPGCSEPEPAAKVGLVFDIGGRGDLSFNDSAYAGLERAMTELGVEAQYLEPSEGGENREELLRTLAEEGYELIFAVGFLFTDAVIKAAADFPETKFALIDGFVPDLTPESNIVCLGFAEHEGSFLVGAAAALKSETNKIGFVGGMEIDLIKKFEVGFMAGAKYVKPDIEFVRNYIGSTGEAFANPTAGRELALAQYDQGCDVIYHASGKSGVGVIAAAAERGKLVIGVDSDQYLTASPEEQPFVLTSMMKRVDVSVFETIKAYAEDAWQGGYATFSASNDGVGYAASNTALIADIQAQLDELKGKIVSGEIVVPATYAEYDEYIANLGQ